jgi:hypothetical protein
MLCRPPAFKNIVLATTKWNNTREDLGHRREQQLKAKHWTVSDILPFDNTFNSAWNLVNHLFEKGPVDASLFHQESMSLQNRLAPQAPAGISGKFINFLVQALREMVPPLLPLPGKHLKTPSVYADKITTMTDINERDIIIP